MKVIFLDIDGVLNAAKLRNGWFVRQDGQEVDGLIGIAREPVACLNRLIEESGAKLVLSSAWRLLHGLERTKANLERSGFRHGDAFVGETPLLVTRAGSVTSVLPRRREIREWARGWTGEPIESFVILDDDDDMGALGPALVLTDPYGFGLTDACVNAAKDVLASGNAGLLEQEKAIDALNTEALKAEAKWYGDLAVALTLDNLKLKGAQHGNGS